MAFGWLKKAAGKVWDVLDPLVPDETIRGIGRAARGNWGDAWNDFKTGTLDGARGVAVGLGGAGLMGAGPLGGVLGGVPGAVGTGIGKVGGALGGAGKVGGAIKGIGSLAGGNLPGMVMGGINAFSNAKDATRYRDYEDEMMDYARSQQGRRMGIEDQILGNLNPDLNVPDLGNLFADPSNPFYQQNQRTPMASIGASMGASPPIASVGGGMPQIQPQIQPDPEPFPRTPPPQPGTPFGPANDVLRRLSPGGAGRVVPLRM